MFLNLAETDLLHWQERDNLDYLCIHQVSFCCRVVCTGFFPPRHEKRNKYWPGRFFPMDILGHRSPKLICTVQAPTLVGTSCVFSDVWMEWIRQKISSQQNAFYCAHVRHMSNKYIMVSCEHMYHSSHTVWFSTNIFCLLFVYCTGRWFLNSVIQLIPGWQFLFSSWFIHTYTVGYTASGACWWIFLLTTCKYSRPVSGFFLELAWVSHL